MDHELAVTLPGVSRGASETLSLPLVARASNAPLEGSVLVLIQFDVCEEIRLDKLRDIFGARTADASFKHQAPGYVPYSAHPSRRTSNPWSSIAGSGFRAKSSIST